MSDDGGLQTCRKWRWQGQVVGDGFEGSDGVWFCGFVVSLGLVGLSRVLSAGRVAQAEGRRRRRRRG